jgi:hypothetical protein
MTPGAVNPRTVYKNPRVNSRDPRPSRMVGRRGRILRGSEVVLKGLYVLVMDGGKMFECLQESGICAHRAKWINGGLAHYGTCLVPYWAYLVFLLEVRAAEDRHRVWGKGDPHHYPGFWDVIVAELTRLNTDVNARYAYLTMLAVEHQAAGDELYKRAREALEGGWAS